MYQTLPKWDARSTLEKAKPIYACSTLKHNQYTGFYPCQNRYFKVCYISITYINQHIFESIKVQVHNVSNDTGNHQYKLLTYPVYEHPFTKLIYIFLYICIYMMYNMNTQDPVNNLIYWFFFYKTINVLYTDALINAIYPYHTSFLQSQKQTSVQDLWESWCTFFRILPSSGTCFLFNFCTTS